MGVNPNGSNQGACRELRGPPLNKIGMASLIAVTLFKASSSHAANVDEVIETMPPSVKKTILKQASSFVPPKYKEAVSEYIDTVGTQVSGGQNAGILKKNAALLAKSPCLSELAGQLYSDLFAESIDAVSNFVETGSTSFIVTPKIDNTVKDVGGTPGLVWEKAVALAQGDKNLALKVISLCGHDDSNQLPDGFRFKSSASVHKAFGRFSGLSSRSDYDDRLKIAVAGYRAQNPNVHFSLEQLKSTLKISVGNSMNSGCPVANHSFYFAQALGSAADINLNLKRKIVRLQAPTKGASAIKSKSYHVIAGAAAGCMLYEKGLPSFASKELVKMAVNAYRASRLCNSNLADWHSLFPRHHEKLLSDALRFRKEGKKCFKVEEKSNGTDPAYTQYTLESNKPGCELATLFSYGFWFDADVTTEMLASKIKRKIGEQDARDLFRKSAAFKDSNECQGTQFTQAIRSYMEENGTDGKTNPCPSDWEKPRCENARLVLASYAVDFEWSEAQQLAGLEFARKNCTELKPEYSHEASACAAVAKNKASNSGAVAPATGSHRETRH